MNVKSGNEVEVGKRVFLEAMSNVVGYGGYRSTCTLIGIGED